MSEQEPRNRPEWGAQEQYPGLCKILKDGLETVLDPELGLSVVQLGLIRDVRYEEKEEGDEIDLDMILTTPFCPYGPELIQQVQEVSEQVLMRPVFVRMTAEMWEPNMMEEGLGDWGLF
jgi:metal-sulfur cluster biosynthetic enzyme